MFINIQLFAHKKVPVLLTMVVIANQRDLDRSAPMVNMSSPATFSFAKEAQNIIRATTQASAKTIRCLHSSTAQSNLSVWANSVSKYPSMPTKKRHYQANNFVNYNKYAPSCTSVHQAVRFILFSCSSSKYCRFLKMKHNNKNQNPAVFSPNIKNMKIFRLS